MAWGYLGLYLCCIVRVDVCHELSNLSIYKFGTSPCTNSNLGYLLNDRQQRQYNAPNQLRIFNRCLYLYLALGATSLFSL